MRVQIPLLSLTKIIIMNLFQEYETARTNPMTITLEYCIRKSNGAFRLIFPGVAFNDEIPISRVVNNFIGEGYGLNTIAYCCYKDEYKDFYVDFCLALIKNNLNLIPEKYHHCYYEFPNESSRYIDCFDYSGSQQAAIFALYKLFCYKDDPDLMINYVIYYMIIANSKDKNSRNRIIEAFKFMCDYRIVPSYF